MPKALLNLLLCSLVSLSISYAVDLDISKAYLNPQMGAMGNSGLANTGSFATSYLNPAILGNIKAWSFSFYNATFENEILNSHYQLIIPFGNNTFSLAYYTQNVNGIPITDYINERIRANGTFSAGAYQLRCGFGQKYKDLWLFKDLDIGYSAGIQKYTFLDDYGTLHRLGLLASSYLWENTFGGIVYDINQDSKVLSYGLTYKDSKYQLNLDYNSNQIRSGIEYSLSNFFQLRCGYEPRYYTFGLGIFYDQLYGLFNSNLALYLDLAYQLPINDYYSACSYFSFTIQEMEKLLAPLIYKYPSLTNQNTTTLSGWGPKNCTIVFYVNDTLLDQTKTNDNGQWEKSIPLRDANNRIKTKSISEIGNKSSEYSKEIQILVDKQKPLLKFMATVIKDHIFLKIVSNKQLKAQPQIITDKEKISVPLYEGKYELETQLASFGQSFSVEGTDLANNKASYHFADAFISFSGQEQKIIITSSSNYKFIGQTDKYAQIVANNSDLNYEEIIPLQKNGQFEKTIPLKFGKNTITFLVKHTNGEISYPFNILRLFQYNDSRNEDYNKLATLGILDQEVNLRPQEMISQKDLISWLIRFKEINVDTIKDNDNWLNNAYNYCLDNHFITKRDDKALLSRIEGMNILCKVLDIDIYSAPKEISYFENISINDENLKYINYFVEHGYISNKTKTYDLTAFLTRGEFLTWLTHTPQLDIVYSHILNEEK